MNIVLDGIVIRDFQRKDAEPLHKIVRESEIIRFMKDWIFQIMSYFDPRMRILLKR